MAEKGKEMIKEHEKTFNSQIIKIPMKLTMNYFLENIRIRLLLNI